WIYASMAWGQRDNGGIWGSHVGRFTMGVHGGTDLGTGAPLSCSTHGHLLCFLAGSLVLRASDGHRLAARATAINGDWDGEQFLTLERIGDQLQIRSFDESLKPLGPPLRVSLSPGDIDGPIRAVRR